MSHIIHCVFIMKVKTIIGKEFAETCRALAESISLNYCPNLIIGVLTGGGYIGRELYDVLKQKNDCAYTELKVQRTNTQKKENTLVKAVLKRAPIFLLNWMRMLESFVLEKRAKKHNPKREGKIVFSAEILKFLESDDRKRILLVDDAIDTGATLNLIKEHLEKHFKNIEIKIAVITVTMPHPIVDADFYLFHNRTLIRFPWSNDLKKK